MADELTPGMKEYFESGGTKTDGLVAENPVTPAPAGTKAPAEAAPAPAPAPVAATPPAPAPDPEEGEEVPTPDGKSKRRMVDSRALKAERVGRQAAEAELAKAREDRARIDERLKLLSEAVSMPAPTTQAPAGPPNVEEDVFGAVKYLVDEMTGLKKVVSEGREQSAEERAAAQAVNTYRNDAARFSQQQPDFMDAYNHLFVARKKQLEAQGYAPEEVNRWLYIEEMGLIDRALKANKSPAQVIYEISGTMGYVRKAPAANGHTAPVPAAPAAAAPAAPATPAAPNVTDEVERIKAGQGAARSLSQGGGGGAPEFSLEAILAMPDKEFMRVMSVPGNREKFEEALGKR